MCVLPQEKHSPDRCPRGCGANPPRPRLPARPGPAAAARHRRCPPSAHTRRGQAGTAGTAGEGDPGPVGIILPPSPSARRRTASSGTAPAAPSPARCGAMRCAGRGSGDRARPRAGLLLEIKKRRCPGERRGTDGDRIPPSSPALLRGSPLPDGGKRLQHPQGKRRKMDAPVKKGHMAGFPLLPLLFFIIIIFFLELVLPQ